MIKHGQINQTTNLHQVARNGLYNPPATLFESQPNINTFSTLKQRICKRTKGVLLFVFSSSWQKVEEKVTSIYFFILNSFNYFNYKLFDYNNK